MRLSRSRRLGAALAAAATLLLIVSSPAVSAESDTPAAPAKKSFVWEGSDAEAAVAKGVDLLIVRPLASARVAVGAVLLIPAALFSSPSGREGIDGAYEVLLEQPIDYAFRRPIGEFD